jgi:pimeloyl-ACP methyl ester carboxylesterase
MADAIVQIFGDARAHLVGHSLGALLALACAPALASRLVSLTALSPVPADGESLLDMAERSAERLASLDLAAALRLRRQREPTTANELELEIFAQATRPLFARESAWLEYPYHRSDAEGFMGLADELLASGWPRQLGTIPARTLLLWGEHDVVPLAAQERLQARLRPTASLRVADAGHMLPVEQPRMVAEALARFFGLCERGPTDPC